MGVNIRTNGASDRFSDKQRPGCSGSCPAEEEQLAPAPELPKTIRTGMSARPRQRPTAVILLSARPSRRAAGLHSAHLRRSVDFGDSLKADGLPRPTTYGTSPNFAKIAATRSITPAQQTVTRTRVRREGTSLANLCASEDGTRLGRASFMVLSRRRSRGPFPLLATGDIEERAGDEGGLGARQP